MMANKQLIKLGKFFADFNFRGSWLTAKYRENWTTWKFPILRYLPNITDELSIEANSVDPEQTAPIGAVWSGSLFFAIEAS